MIVFLKKIVRSSYIFRYCKARLYVGFVIRNRLLKNLVNTRNTNLPVDVFDKKILIPIIETSHYHFYKILLIGKALELRGAEVRVLVCDGFLPGCEVRSSRSPKVDPCMNCKMNKKN